MDRSKLYQQKPVAEFLGLSVSTLQNWRAAGKGPKFLKVGLGKRGPVRYRGEDVLAFVEAQTTRNARMAA